MLVKAIKKDNGTFDIVYYNGVNLGTFEYGADGYLYYWPLLKSGCWASQPMREIANLLDSLNDKWDKEVNKQSFIK